MSDNNGSGPGRYKNGKKRHWKKIWTDRAKTNQTKHAIKDTGKDILAAIVGGAAGAAMGWPSFLVGIPVNFLGHFFESQAVATAGTAMMVTTVNELIPSDKTVEPTKWEKAKARLSAYKDSMMKKMMLDKVFKKDASTDTTTSEPVGEIKHFVYPYADGSTPQLDFSAMDAIENQLVNSARNFQNQGSMNTTVNSSVNGAEFIDPLY